MANIGRPLKYKPEEITAIVGDYFADCETKKTIPTKSGLLLALDMSRETWREYKEKEEFVYTIKRAELLIEEAWVQRLGGNNVAGTIFYLKNAFKEEYKDRTETSLTFENEEAKEKSDKLVKDYLGNRGTD